VGQFVGDYLNPILKPHLVMPSAQLESASLLAQPPRKNDDASFTSRIAA
jgi:hypothetical protein